MEVDEGKTRDHQERGLMMLCKVEGCGRPAMTRRLCGKHYKRLWRHGDVNHCETPEYTGLEKCINPDCGALATIAGLCHACYQRANRTGSLVRSIAPKGSGTTTAAGYVLITDEHGVRVFLHRRIMEEQLGRKLTAEEVVHHIDGNPKNNSPDNLLLFPNQSEHMKFHQLRRSN